ncbi:T5orf172 domain-containing protein [Ancylobacter aquaticus]|uniref:T5orf172 domain-containing protein n=1 Tax=Ancylobacter aquaticus TaxID=100 RepID=A0A4R1IBI1_ANCAQ|nr:GIY-YIG nuclease family protein [Ancylobacter aquaticus]TCK31050.1 T5orf172 domain-containing protein [Ancylobacter aquaticus]
MTVVYVLTNQAMPGLIKIGRTADTIENRMRQLDTTGLPLPFECFYAAEVQTPDRVERALHEAFDDHRVRRNREFFSLSPDKAKAIIKLLELREVTPGADVITEIGDQEALNQARRRRSHFRFSMLNISPGSELVSVFDDNITASVKDDRWIIFRGEEDSLSNSALTIAHEKGRMWPSVAGPSYWKYEGKTLEQLRQASVSSGDEE